VIRPYSHSLSDDEANYKTKEERESEALRDPVKNLSGAAAARGHSSRRMSSTRSTAT